MLLRESEAEESSMREIEGKEGEFCMSPTGGCGSDTGAAEHECTNGEGDSKLRGESGPKKGSSKPGCESDALNSQGMAPSRTMRVCNECTNEALSPWNYCVDCIRSGSGEQRAEPHHYQKHSMDGRQKRCRSRELAEQVAQ